MSEYLTTLSKDQWLTLVQKELKDKPYESIIRQISSRISAEPYYTSAEVSDRFQPLIIYNNWQSAEDFHHHPGQEAALNAQILEALNGGIQSLTLHFDVLPDVPAFAQIFDAVSLDSITVFFKFHQILNTTQLKSFLTKLCESTHIVPNQLQGGILQSCADTELYNEFPGIRWHHCSVKENDCAPEPEQILAGLLTEADAIISSITSGRQEEIFSKFHFTINIANDFLVELSKIRAFYLLWANYQLAYGIVQPYQPFIHAGICESAYTDDENKNMIKASAIAMAAVTGGASRITVRPSGKNGNSFQRRIARNVLNLLELEAGMKSMPDPAAGSYYIEILTQKLADAAWEIFRMNKDTEISQ